MAITPSAGKGVNPSVSEYKARLSQTSSRSHGISHMLENVHTAMFFEARKWNGVSLGFSLPKLFSLHWHVSQGSVSVAVQIQMLLLFC